MKLCTYLLKIQTNPKEARLGVCYENRIIDLANASGGKLPSDMLSFLEAGDPALEAAKKLLTPALAESALPLTDVKLQAPILNPSAIIAIGLNYFDHCRETNMPVPEKPVIFCKMRGTLTADQTEVVWDPAVTSQVDWEVELAFVVGKKARNVSEEKAFEYVAGYTVCNDVSARDLQFNAGANQWILGKSLDTFSPMGPYLVTKDEIKDPHNLNLGCTVNGTVMQNSNTRELIFKVPTLVAYLSKHFTLNPGDVVLTGTPPGIGAFRDPKIFLKNGDVVKVYIEGLGELTNTCVEQKQ